MPLFTRQDLKTMPLKLLRDGRMANTKVFCATFNGELWTVKDFGDRPWYVRNTIGRFLIRREVAFLQRLEGIDGVSPGAFRIDAFAMAVRFVPGETVHKTRRELVTPEFLEALEALLNRIHERHVVHLDCRGVGNVLYREDGKPALIDFQSALYTRFMPRFLRRALEDLDRSAVLKRWKRYHPNLMGEKRLREFERIEKLRHLWVLQGYFGVKKDGAKEDAHSEK